MNWRLWVLCGVLLAAVIVVCLLPPSPRDQAYHSFADKCPLWGIPNDATGLVVLGDNGADRVVVGHVGGPQVRGIAGHRISPATGIQINDKEGNERGGLGLMDNSRMVLGMDYPDQGEGLAVAVVPDQGFAGFVINAGKGMKAGLKRNAASGDDRSLLFVDGEEPTRFLLMAPKSGAPVDVLEKIKP